MSHKYVQVSFTTDVLDTLSTTYQESADLIREEAVLDCTGKVGCIAGRLQKY